MRCGRQMRSGPERQRRRNRTRGRFFPGKCCDCLDLLLRYQSPLGGSIQPKTLACLYGRGYYKPKESRCLGDTMTDGGGLLFISPGRLFGGHTIDALACMTEYARTKPTLSTSSAEWRRRLGQANGATRRKGKEALHVGLRCWKTQCAFSSLYILPSSRVEGPAAPSQPAPAAAVRTSRCCREPSWNGRMHPPMQRKAAQCGKRGCRGSFARRSLCPHEASRRAKKPAQTRDKLSLVPVAGNSSSGLTTRGDGDRG